MWWRGLQISGGLFGETPSWKYFMEGITYVLASSTLAQTLFLRQWQRLRAALSFYQSFLPTFNNVSFIYIYIYISIYTYTHIYIHTYIYNDFFPIIAGLQCSVNFPLYSMVTQLHIHVYILFSHIIMFHHKWPDIVPSGTQQDLIANPFQRQ